MDENIRAEKCRRPEFFPHECFRRELKSSNIVHINSLLFRSLRYGLEFANIWVQKTNRRFLEVEEITLLSLNNKSFRHLSFRDRSDLNTLDTSTRIGRINMSCARAQ